MSNQDHKKMLSRRDFLKTSYRRTFGMHQRRDDSYRRF